MQQHQRYDRSFYNLAALSVASSVFIADPWLHLPK